MQTASLQYHRQAFLQASSLMEAMRGGSWRRNPLGKLPWEIGIPRASIGCQLADLLGYFSPGEAEAKFGHHNKVDLFMMALWWPLHHALARRRKMPSSSSRLAEHRSWTPQPLTAVFSRFHMQSPFLIMGILLGEAAVWEFHSSTVDNFMVLCSTSNKTSAGQR